MRILVDTDLAKLTTVNIGGTAKTLVIPESTKELIELIREKTPAYFIGGGSNLLINEHEFEMVVDLRYFDTSIDVLGEGRFCVGASTRLQTLINTINQQNRGGIEYLYSVPGLVGGAVVMNAGRGKEHNQTISDYIISVDAVRDGNPITLSREECGFDHRTSVFKNTTTIVTSVHFAFPQKNTIESAKEKKKRLEYCKEKQDTLSPNFGSVFMEFNPIIMEAVKRIKLGGTKAHFSGKTRNWMLNAEHASYKDVMRAIEKAETLHKLLGQKCSREVVVWD